MTNNRQEKDLQKSTVVPLVFELKKEMEKLRNPERAKVLSRFFKTGKGQYGEGDLFLGIPVPEQRRMARRFTHMPMKDLSKLVSGRIHEHRLVALLILITKYKKADASGKKEIIDFYTASTKHINNWDLVDLSAPYLLGEYLCDKDRSILYRMARSPYLWERRIAIMSTFAFIKRNDFGDTLAIAELLLKDHHDLIHKAVGWMLREVGKRDQAKEEEFLSRHRSVMPRTMLRYAIERFDEDKRRFYLKAPEHTDQAASV